MPKTFQTTGNRALDLELDRLWARLEQCCKCACQCAGVSGTAGASASGGASTADDDDRVAVGDIGGLDQVGLPKGVVRLRLSDGSFDGEVEYIELDSSYLVAVPRGGGGVILGDPSSPPAADITVDPV